MLNDSVGFVFNEIFLEQIDRVGVIGKIYNVQIFKHTDDIFCGR
jgi:hypothetical protein